MGTGSGHDSQNIEISGGWPVPVAIFSQTLSSAQPLPSAFEHRRLLSARTEMEEVITYVETL
jgi:hypothetical protein